MLDYNLTQWYVIYNINYQSWQNRNIMANSKDQKNKVKDNLYLVWKVSTYILIL